jgi:hypothetical protein
MLRGSRGQGPAGTTHRQCSQGLECDRNGPQDCEAQISEECAKRLIIGFRGLDSLSGGQLSARSPQFSLNTVKYCLRYPVTSEIHVCVLALLFPSE